MEKSLYPKDKDCIINTVRTMIIKFITVIKIIIRVRTGIVIQRAPPELKHLSRVRKINQLRFRK